jgi:hypothetical protein
MRYRHLARQWVATFLVGGLALAGSSRVFGQAPTSPQENAAVTQPAETFSQAPSGGTERAWSGPPSTEGPKTFWETVPHITPYPRTGNFYVMPSGPGYYTLLDFLRGRESQERPHDPYLQWGQNPNPFFNVDFRYLDNPNNTETDFLDPLKRVHIGDNWLFSTGGEIRNRYAWIDNANLYNKNKTQAGNDDRYDLFRARVYGDVWYLDQFRIFGEFMSNDSSAQSIPRANSDVNKADIFNLFAELKIWTIDDNGVYLRGGRQELLFGSQRLISPSDWSNTMRTFQGVRGMWHNDTIEYDAFWVQPVIVNTGKLDSVDDKQQFFGSWLKYRINKDQSFDFYYLNLDNNNPKVATGQYKATGGFDVNTIGGRLVGEQDRILWDFEGAVQCGDWVNQGMFAAMSSTGLGWYFKNLPATPTAWIYYDYASGDPHGNTSNLHQTFDQLFPFGHQYYDSIDLFGRQNIDDFHIDFAFFPAPWVRITGGYHYLTLDQAKDALYSTSGSVTRVDPTGKAGTDIGNAISSSIQFHLDRHQVLNVSYAHLFSGPYIDKTAIDANAKKDVDSIWVQYILKW